MKFLLFVILISVEARAEVVFEKPVSPPNQTSKAICDLKIPKDRRVSALVKRMKVQAGCQ